MTNTPSDRGAILAVAFAIVASVGCTTDTSPATPRPVVAYELGPTSGPMVGGTAVTVRLHAFAPLAEGAGFQPGAIVEFGGAAATKVIVLNDTLITAIAPSWTLAYDSTLAHEPQGFDTTRSIREFIFFVTVSPGEKTKGVDSVGLFTYDDTTGCAGCWDYRRQRGTKR